MQCTYDSKAYVVREWKSRECMNLVRQFIASKHKKWETERENSNGTEIVCVRTINDGVGGNDYNGDSGGGGDDSDNNGRRWANEWTIKRCEEWSQHETQHTVLSLLLGGKNGRERTTSDDNRWMIFFHLWWHGTAQQLKQNVECC